MVHEILPVGMLQCNCSIFGDEQSGDAVVIDPGDNLARIEAVLERHGLHVKAIVITHAHIDHIGGAHKLHASTGAPVYMNENDDKLQDMMDMQARGWGYRRRSAPRSIWRRARAISCARQARSSTCCIRPAIRREASACGCPRKRNWWPAIRCSATASAAPISPYGDGDQFLRSIHDKYFALPDETVVVPGHGPVTTLGREKQFNYFLQGM